MDHDMARHPAGTSNHRVTADHTVEVAGDRARSDARFVAFRIQAAARPGSGRAEGAFGARGTVQPIESGYEAPACDGSTASGRP